MGGDPPGHARSGTVGQASGTASPLRVYDRRDMLKALLSLLAAAALLASCGGGSGHDLTPSPVAPGGISTVYLVTNDDDSYNGLKPLVLKPIEPATGRDLPGYAPASLGHHGVWAVSPDGRTLASAVAEDSFGPERLSLFDLDRWTPLRDLDFAAHDMQLFWSKDGSRLYVVASTDCGAECRDLRSELVIVDTSDGHVAARFPLPFAPMTSHLSPDDRTLYVFGNDSYYADTDTLRPPRLIAIDVESGRSRAELAFPDVLYGQRRESDAQGDVSYTTYLSGTAMSPAGAAYYIFHPDSDDVTVVDLRTMRVARTQAIRQRVSLFQRFRSVFSLVPGTAHAKGGEVRGNGFVLSPDGRRFYRVLAPDRHGLDPGDAGEPAVLQVIDAESMQLVRERDLYRDGFGYGNLSFDLTGRYLYFTHVLDLFVLDTSTLDTVSQRRVYPIGPSIVVAPPREGEDVP